MGEVMEVGLRETTLRDYLRVLFRQKAAVITVFLAVMVIAYIGLRLKTPVYEAEVKILVSSEKQLMPSYHQGLMGSQRAGEALTQAEIVKSNPVIERAAKAMGLCQKSLDYEKKFSSPLKYRLIDFQVSSLNKKMGGFNLEQKQAFICRLAVDDLRGHIKVEPLRDTNILSIRVRDYSPVGAAIMANAVSRSYVIFDLEQQLAELQLKYGEKHQTIIQMKGNIERMVNNLGGERLADIEVIGPANVKIMEQASIPLKPIGPPKPLVFILALFIGIFLSIMIAFAFEYMDQSIKSPRDIESSLGLPLVGFTVKRKAWDKPLVKDAKRENQYTQSYRILSEQIYLLAKQKDIKSLLITACEVQEAGVVAANLGFCLTHGLGHKVLLIDANMRNPLLHKILNTPMSMGLAEVLNAKISFESASQNLGDGLTILPAGKAEPNTPALLDSLRMSQFIKTATEKYDIVLFNCAELKYPHDALLLSNHIDGIILSVSEAKTRRQVAKALIEPLKHKKANLIGVILHNRTFAIPKIIYNRL
ncbi:MAG: Wzz/FepE/Etk N-terminal domain-containing protein [Candidatus Omnitrophota bacterium]